MFRYLFIMNYFSIALLRNIMTKNIKYIDVFHMNTWLSYLQFNFVSFYCSPKIFLDCQRSKTYTSSPLLKYISLNKLQCCFLNNRSIIQTNFHEETIFNFYLSYEKIFIQSFVILPLIKYHLYGYKWSRNKYYANLKHHSFWHFFWHFLKQYLVLSW